MLTARREPPSDEGSGGFPTSSELRRWEDESYAYSPKKKFPWWIIVVGVPLLALALAGIGVIAYVIYEAITDSFEVLPWLAVGLGLLAASILLAALPSLVARWPGDR